METALRRIADMLEAFFEAASAWFAAGAWRPETWPGITWVLVAALVVLTWLLAWRRRAPRALDVRPPQLLVTSGEVVPDGTDEPGVRPSGRRRRRLEPVAQAAAGAYTMTVSNLSRYPVQLLEVALRDGRRGAARVAALDAIVPAMGSVTVSGRIPLGLRGDGWLDLYAYAPAPRVKMHRHRVELVWEPWAARFKAAPLEQVSAPARRLASDEPEARFLEDDAPEPVEPVAAVVRAPAADRRDEPPRSGRAAAVDDRPRSASAPSGAAPRPVPETPEPIPAAPVPAAAPAPARAPARAGAADPVPAPAPIPAPAPAPTAAAPEPVGRNPVARPPVAREPIPPERVPRIATPPVGVAVAGRGGAAARTEDGVPIGRPTARPEPAPAPIPAPAPVAAPADEDVPADAPPPDPPPRRRPRLEFPDEF